MSEQYTAAALSTLNKADLLAILMSEFGHVVSDSDKKSDLIEKIMELQAGAFHVSDSLKVSGDRDEDGGITAPKSENDYDPEARTWIKIANDEHDTYDVFLSVNGDSCSVKRERWAHVKNKFIKGPLNDAVQTLYRAGKAHEKRRFNVTIWQGAGAPVESDDGAEQVITPLMV